MSGTERAALLLMTLGEQEAAEVLKYMGAEEVQELGAAMANLKNVTRDAAGNVLDVFITDVEDQTALGVNTEGYVRKLLGNAFGESKAQAFLDRIDVGDGAKGLDALKWMGTQDVVNIIEAGEHEVPRSEGERAAQQRARGARGHPSRGEGVFRLAQSLP